MFDVLLRVVTVAAAIVVIVLAVRLYQHVKGVADHPCPPGRIVMLAPTGWGCGDSLNISGKSRP